MEGGTSPVRLLRKGLGVRQLVLMLLGGEIGVRQKKLWRGYAVTPDARLSNAFRNSVGVFAWTKTSSAVTPCSTRRIPR